MNDQFFEGIFKRKSIRKYDMTPLPEDKLTMVREFAHTVKALDNTIKYEFSYLSAGDVKNILPIKAPHYICLYSEKRDNYLMNAGFLLQQMDLFFSVHDLASCWLGMAKPTKQVPEQQNGLEFVIMLAFGNSIEPIHRADIAEFKRKSMTEITDIKGVEELLEPARLAPSASNTQPWYFSGSAEEIIVSREKLNIIREPLYGRMNQIDIGITLCHLWLSLDDQGKTPIYDFKKEPSPKGYEFMVKVKVSNHKAV